MAELFPGSLTEKFNTQGFSVDVGETKVRSNTDIGPFKVRARFTDGIDGYRVSFDFTKDELAIFKDWYKTTLSNGVKTFLFLDPLTDTTEEFRFIGTYSKAPLNNSGIRFRLSMSWELLP